VGLYAQEVLNTNNNYSTNRLSVLTDIKYCLNKTERSRAMNINLKLDEWLNKYRVARTDYLNIIAAKIAVAESALGEALKSKEYETITVRDYSAVRGYYDKEVKALVVRIGDKKYYKYNGNNPIWKQYCADYGGYTDVSISDAQLALYNPQDIPLMIEREVEDKRRFIISKASTICGDDLEILADYGDIVLVTGSTRRKCNITIIFAGGYNIQCLHIRVLVKEVAYYAAEKD
jgi:hypothetical protein